MDRLDRIVDTLQRMNLKVNRRRLLQGGFFAGLNLTILARLATEPVAPVDAADNVITMWAFPLTSNDTEKLWGPLLKKFRQQNPDLTVKISLLPWNNRRERMLTAFASKSTPDVSYLNNDMLIPWSKAGMLVPLDPYFTHTAQADFTASVMSGCRYKGRLMMVPTLVGPHTPVYNRDLFKKIGADPEAPPATWDAVFKLCALAQKKGYYGTDWVIGNQEQFDSILWSAGGHYLNSAGTKSTINTPEGVAAAEFVIKLFDNKWVPAYGNTLQVPTNPPDYFISRKEVMSGIQPASYPPQVLQQMKGANIGVAPVIKAKDQACFGDVGTFGIFSTAKNSAAAGKWIQFLMQPENLAFYNTISGFVPPRASAYKLWHVDPLIKQFAQAVKYIRIDRDTFFYYGQEAQFVLPALQKAVLHQMTAKQAMDQAAQQLDAYIANVTGNG